MIDEAVLQRVLGVALRTGGDFAEVFAEDRRASSASLEEGKVEELTSGRDRGAGIRVIRGETTGFAHTADLGENGLREAAEAAAAAARSTPGGVQVAALTRREAPRPHDVEILPEDVPKARKVELLLRADEAARSEGDAIRQAAVGYGDSRRRILVANSDGLLVEDDQVRTRFFVECVAVGDTGMQVGYEAPGRTVGFEFYDEVDVEEIARVAARRALEMLKARPAPGLSARADGADDEHLCARRHRRPPRDHPPDAPRHLLRAARRRTGEHGHRRLRLRDDGGLHDRGRRGHRPGARRQPHRQRPRGAAVDRRARQRLRHVGGHVRQGRPGRAGVVGATDPARGEHHRGRHGRRMTAGRELLDLADRVAGWAKDGEQVEAYVSRSRDTDIRVFEGDVESLSSSESEGIGVRVIAGGRQGFAYAGTLDPSVLEEVLGEARDNAAFGAVDDCYGLPVPDGVAVADLDLFRPELGRFPTEREVE